MVSVKAREGKPGAPESPPSLGAMTFPTIGMDELANKLRAEASHATALHSGPGLLKDCEICRGVTVGDTVQTILRDLGENILEEI